jgi:nucleotide-binding universal stress UspA family protein
MDILVPIDGSECSERALAFAVDFAHRFDASVNVVHVTDHRTEATEELLQRAEQTLAKEGIPSAPEVVFEMKKFRGSDVVGERILDIAEEEEYDHVVMGHHGTGAIGKMILGSAAETVVQGTDVPVTIIP